MAHPEELDLGFGKHSIFVRYPYLLPNLIIAIVALVVMLIIVAVYTSKYDPDDPENAGSDETYFSLMS